MAGVGERVADERRADEAGRDLQLTLEYERAQPIAGVQPLFRGIEQCVGDRECVRGLRVGGEPSVRRHVLAL